MIPGGSGIALRELGCEGATADMLGEAWPEMAIPRETTKEMRDMIGGWGKGLELPRGDCLQGAEIPWQTQDLSHAGDLMS